MLQVQAGKQRLLLTADIDATAEAQLLAAGIDLQAAALKVAHHGAATGSSTAFLDAVAPAVAVVSVGADNRFGHPAAETLARLDEAGATIYRTDRCGTIELFTDGQRLWVHVERAGDDALEP